MRSRKIQAFEEDMIFPFTGGLVYKWQQFYMNHEALIKDVRAQNFPRTDFFETLTSGRKWEDYTKNVKKIGGNRTRFKDKEHHRP